jgi:hypothetical protein
MIGCVVLSWHLIGCVPPPSPRLAAGGGCIGCDKPYPCNVKECVICLYLISSLSAVFIAAVGFVSIFLHLHIGPLPLEPQRSLSPSSVFPNSPRDATRQPQLSPRRHLSTPTPPATQPVKPDSSRCATCNLTSISMSTPRLGIGSTDLRIWRIGIGCIGYRV